jgi:hypothetical protein
MGKWIHKLDNINVVDMVADCRYCGPVKVIKNGKRPNGKTRYRCSVLTRAKFTKINIDDALRLYKETQCSICGNTDGLVFDHSHTTGLARGLLCNHCNRGLGCFKDNIITLERAIKYLQL